MIAPVRSMIRSQAVVKVLFRDASRPDVAPNLCAALNALLPMMPPRPRIKALQRGGFVTDTR